MIPIFGPLARLDLLKPFAVPCAVGVSGSLRGGKEKRLKEGGGASVGVAIGGGDEVSGKSNWTLDGRLLFKGPSMSQPIPDAFVADSVLAAMAIRGAMTQAFCARKSLNCNHLSVKGFTAAS